MGNLRFPQPSCVLLLLALFTGVGAFAAPIIIDFESVPANGPGTPAAGIVTTISGVTFNGPVPLDYSLGSTIPGFAHSGTKAIEQCYGREFCSTPFQLTFTKAQSHVKLWIGYGAALSIMRTVDLVAFDSAGAVVGKASAALLPSPGPQPIRIPLEVNSATARIVAVTVGFAPGLMLTNHLAIDDVEIDVAGPPPPCTATHSPFVSIVQPPVTGKTVQVNEFTLQASISTETPLEAVLLTGFNAGFTDSRGLDLLASGAVGAGGKDFGPLRINGLLFPGSNTVFVEARNCLGTGKAFVTITLTPIAAGTSFKMLAIEVTQAVQDLRHSVPLIADKRSVVRVYLGLSGPTSKILKVSGRLSGCRALSESSPLCDSPLASVRASNVIDVTSSSDITSRRADINASLNFELPPEWLSAGLFHVELAGLTIDDAESSLPCDSCNNPNPAFPSFPSFQLFEEAPPVRLKLFRIGYRATNPSTGKPFAFFPLPLDSTLLRSWIRRAYPIARLETLPDPLPTLNFKGIPVPGSSKSGVSFNCDDVDGRLATLRALDLANGGDQRLHYYAIARDGGNTSTYFLRGCSTVPGHVASGPSGSSTWGWDFDGSYADWYGAHEIGHGFGRNHPFAGCSQNAKGDRGSCPNPREATATNQGCGQTPDDRDYPYPAPAPVASIDTPIGGPAATPARFFGFDLGDTSNRDSAGNVVTPAKVMTAVTPFRATDVMSYCPNEWVSDYTYEGILGRLRVEDAAGPTPASSIHTVLVPPTPPEFLLVQGTVNLTQNTVALKPMMRLSALSPTLPPLNSPFSVLMLGVAGTLLGQFPISLLPLSEVPGGEDQLAQFSEVVPFVPGTAHIVIANNGVGLASRSVTLNRPVVKVVWPQGGAVLSGAVNVAWSAFDPDGGALTFALLYSPDGGQTWQTIDADIDQQTYLLNTAQLPGSNQALFRVVATDGVNAAFADSPQPFQVVPKPPQVRVLSPARRSAFTSSDTIILRGEVADVQDGLLDGNQVQWLSNIQGVLGFGRALSLTGLLPGRHIVTLQATNRFGQVGSARLRIDVTRELPRLFVATVF